MKWYKQALANDQAEIDAPASGKLKWFRCLFVLFFFSFVFDYRSPGLEFGAVSTGGSLFQFAFIGMALFSGGLATLLGVKHLLVKPGVYMVLLWWGYIVMSLAVAFLWGNEPGRILRLAVSPLLVGLGINTTLIVAANGMRPGEVVRWFLLAALANVVWRFAFGALAYDSPLSEIRMEILSPAIGFLFSWVGCAFLLRHKFSWFSLVIFGVPLAVAAISVTRSLALPLMVSFLAGGFCLALAMAWRMYDLRFPLRKIGPLIAMGGAMTFVIVGVALLQPNLAERWHQRLFDNRGEGVETSEDVSTLMRKAEAKSMWDILSQEPHSFVWGRGLGAAYYWDEDYYPELFILYPDDRHQFPDEIFTAGHSIWTYTLFSTGFIGIGITLLSFFFPIGLSLHSAYLNSRTVMGPRAWDSFLAFLPFVSMWATLSESVTRNPFDERFTGVLFGFMIALPQFFYNRAFYLTYREARGQESSQLILDEETAAHLEGSTPDSQFQGRVAPEREGNKGGGHHLVGCRYEFEPPPDRRIG